MPPKLVSDDGRNIVIRPLAYCKEKDLAEYAEIENFPIIPCNLCGSQKNMQRQAVKEMLQQWDKKFPGRLETMFTALQNIQPSHLADPRLYNFAELKAGNKPFPDGDQAFRPRDVRARDGRNAEPGEGAGLNAGSLTILLHFVVAVRPSSSEFRGVNP